jgi:hypothetical protein
MSSQARNLKIHRNQTMAMQSILLSMSRGYVWWVTGLIETRKAVGLVDKFNERFGIQKAKLSLERRATRESRKAALDGKPHVRHSASLVIHPVVGKHEMRWVLLATGPLDGEDMKNGALPSQRLVWGKYQISQIPKQDSGQTWTWRLTREAENEMEGWGIKLARSNRQAEMQGYLDLAKNYPMFAGVRKQIGKALDRSLTVWNKQHPGLPMKRSGPLPVMTRHSAYDNPPLTLGALVDGYEAYVLDVQRRLMRGSADAFKVPMQPDLLESHGIH